MTALAAQISAEPEDTLMPRAQVGAQPQHLLVTLLGDYWFGDPEQLPSAALVEILAEFGISPTSARAALGRLTRRGLLQSSKVGRRTFYGLTPLAERVFHEGLRRILSFGIESSHEWDGTWLVVVFSVPEDQRDVRHSLRSQLRWQGFAPLYDGVWVSPSGEESAVGTIISDLGLESATVLRSAALYPASGGRGHPLSAWDLDDLRTKYDQFIDEFAPLLDRVRRGHVTASEALLARTSVMDTWRRFPNLDPELPSGVLPDKWPRRLSRDIFTEVYDKLGPLAEFRVRQIIAGHAPELAHRARHFTTASALARALG